ncbi:MAG: hypothetical protein REI96_01170 [Flavobacterium nitrogenifigens]|uniref:hypothetical protein n=1 Tax=Flavobacterium nitrogenifigens TaxID=1617283 RepID=UPI002807ADA3|nr:hypothetical protein [Flavobacterium nitrogenifigens]MDQ8011029.1 hypothetical protein [Flavobacterium nitrogenifigens]
MKKLITTCCLALLFSACGQENKKTINKKIMNIQYPEINASNFEQRLLNAVKYYEKEPMYYMRINKINCLVEIFINDYRVHKDYELSNYATPLEINDAILKSGEQKLTYRLYPIGDLIKEEYGEGDTVKTLTNATSISISIIKMDNNGEKRLEDEEVIIKHSSLNDAKGNFIASGKPYYEFTFPFNAFVPYENEGWTKGQDLTKLDQKLLEQKALEFYNEYSKVYKNKNLNLLAQLSFGEEKRNAISFYKRASNINKLWKEYLNDINESNLKALPIENYKMTFWGNGKIVFLQLKSLNITYRGGGALIIDSDKSTYMPKILLYLPEGKRLEDGLYMIN